MKLMGEIAQAVARSDKTQDEGGNFSRVTVGGGEQSDDLRKRPVSSDGGDHFMHITTLDERANGLHELSRINRAVFLHKVILG